jgi:hypothetical protein
VPPQRSIPTPQQNFIPSAPAQSNLTQISSHIPPNSLPHNGALAQMSGAPPQQSPQIAHPPSQQSILPHKLPPLPEERFKGVFLQFTAASGIRLTESDLTIEGRPINLWALHKAVFLRNGFETVCLGMNDSCGVGSNGRIRYARTTNGRLLGRIWGSLCSQEGMPVSLDVAGLRLRTGYNSYIMTFYDTSTKPTLTVSFLG